MKKFSIIVAMDEKKWIWKDWNLPWHISSDLKYFKHITSKTLDKNKKNAVIMWRITWQSIPEKYKPLPDRLNIVLSTSLSNEPWVLIKNSMKQTMKYLETQENIENIFVIWWASLYNKLIESEFLDQIYISEVLWDFNCDTFFSSFNKNNFIKISTWSDQNENWIRFRFCIYKKQ